jgi:hypothetical protein
MSFEVPQGWVDRTVLAFAAPPGADPAEHLPNVVMTREAIGKGDSLRTHADRTLLDMARQLDGFDILESRESVLGGRRAIYVRFSWKSNAGELEQDMTMCESPAEPGETDLFATIVTTTAHKKVVDKVRPLFDQFLSSVRFPAPGAPVPPPAGSSNAPPPLAATDPAFSSGSSAPIFGARRK